ncbi:hypothetical protein DFH07DRAFT_889913 [Mycena maculata]|uniref:Copper acquisition factor BIM1-like domain-containing protein n=1 Tax=Mycena maculata TaxID=230809 RepID=A0AAD7ILJ7_9AGAR|nr:hypothetical protein DFH07DRAFT_889913 [Mycena maculata]
MLAFPALVFASLLALVNAHFQLQFPLPRGPFVMDSEPNFCDGYTNAVSNRTIFPLTGGFFSLNSEHTSWTAGVAISTIQDPTSFNDFAQIVPFFKDSGEGLFCFPLDLLSTNATGLTSGENVTIQITFDGGDGELFQCADLTLSSTATIPSNVSCTNGTSSASGSATSTAPAGASATSGSPANTTSGSSAGAATTSDLCVRLTYELLLLLFIYNMLAFTVLVFASFLALVNAHFQLQFPLPRGPFVMDSEPTFCGAPRCVCTGVAISTIQNPTSFNDFAQIVPFFKDSGEGLFCFPLDLLSTNATGLTSGENVTIQITFDGGDGELFQCADLTLSSTATIPANVSCTNGTASASSTATSTAPAGTASVSKTSGSGSPASTSSSTASGLHVDGGFVALIFGLLGVAAVL